MVLKGLFEELWRTNRLRTVLVLVGLILNILLFGVLLTSMLPGLEKDQTTLLKQQAIERRAGTDSSSQNRPSASAILERFYGQVVAYEKFPEFLQQLYQYSGDAGLNIDRITYRPEKTDLRTVLRYELDFSVIGQYGQIKVFLHALEGWPQLVVVEQVKLSGQKPDRDEVVLSIRLAAYFKTVPS